MHLTSTGLKFITRASVDLWLNISNNTYVKTFSKKFKIKTHHTRYNDFKHNYKQKNVSV